MYSTIVIEHSSVFYKECVPCLSLSQMIFTITNITQKTQISNHNCCIDYSHNRNLYKQRHRYNNDSSNVVSKTR